MPRGRPKKKETLAVEAEIAAVAPTVKVVPRETISVEKKKEKTGQCNRCHHDAAMHYGSEFDWCNVTRCQCQGWVD